MNPGLWAALASSFLWGMLPLYWRLLHDVPPDMILCHRILWSCVFLVPLVLCSGRMGEVVTAARSLKTLGSLVLSSVFLACNWLVFIWAVNNDRVLETSLGYYINPLITICMGVVIFRDRPGRPQQIAIGIAAAGVCAEIAITGTFSWVAILLAVSFALYALLRKLAPVESLPGLALETCILAPFALGYVLWGNASQASAFLGNGMAQTMLLTGTGAITSIPLILYAYGARHIPFTTLGVLQYLSPTLTFMIGLFAFGETFSFGRAVSFSAIWIALAIYTVGSFKRHCPNSNISPDIDRE